MGTPEGRTFVYSGAMFALILVILSMFWISNRQGRVKASRNSRTRLKRLYIYGLCLCILSGALLVSPSGQTTVSRYFNPVKDPSYHLFDFNSGYGSDVFDTAGSASGTITNAAWKSEDLCYEGKCLYFDGNGDYINLGDNNDFDFDSSVNFSVMLWFRHKPKTSGSAEILLSKVSTTNGSFTSAGYLLYMETDGDISFAIDDDTSWTPVPDAIMTTTAATYDDNVWHHLAVTKTGTSQMDMYIDGVLVASNSNISGIGHLSNSGNLIIGSQQAGGTGALYYTGFLDQVKIFTTSARTVDQLKTDILPGSSDFGSVATVGFPGSPILSDGLVGYWKFDETSWTVDCSSQTVLDTSGNTNNGAACPNSTGPSGGASGKFGNSAGLDGNNDYISIQNSSSLIPGNGSWSISAWAKSANTDQSTIIALKANISGEQYFLGFCGNQGCGQAGQHLSAGLVENSTTTYRHAISTSDDIDGQWHYYTMVADKTTDTIYLYKDGVRLTAIENKVGSWPTVNNEDGLYLGGFSGGGTINGNLDEVRIYSRALSESDIKQFYLWTPGPVGWWKMDEGSWNGTAGEVKDSSGNSLNGQAYGGAVISDGKYGNAGKFDGTNDYVSISHNTLLVPTGNMTIHLWFYFHQLPSAAGRSFNLLLKSTDSAPWGSYRIWSDSSDNNTLKFDWYASDSTEIQAQYPGNNLQNNTWYHLTAIRDQNTTKLYVNGQHGDVDGNTTGKSINSADASSLRLGVLGTSPLSQMLDGKLDDVRIYNYARTSAQIFEDMNAGHPAPGSPVGSAVASWNFDDLGYETYFSSTVLHDTSGTTDETLYSATNAPTYTAGGKYSGAFDFEKDSSQYMSNYGVFDARPSLNDNVDTYMQDTTATTNYGSAAQLWTDAGQRHTLIKFPQVSLIPTTAECISATLTLVNFLTGAANRSYGIYSLHSNTAFWSETEATWNDYKSGTNWPGSAGATTSGTDYEADASAPTITYTANDPQYTQNTADLTTGANMNCNRIEGWFGDNNTNYGMVIGPSGNTQAFQWMSGDSTTESYRPRLQIGFASEISALAITGDVTLSAWIKPESVTAATQFDILGKWDGANESYLLALYGDEIRMYVDSASNYATTDAANLVTDTWYHVTGVYDAAAETVTLYINGLEFASTVTGTIPSSIGSDSGRVSIGAEDTSSSPANFFDGVIDEPAVYASALTESQIALLVNRKAAMSAGNASTYTSEEGFLLPNPKLHLDYEETNARYVPDLSGNNNTADLYKADAVCVGVIPAPVAQPYANASLGKALYAVPCGEGSQSQIAASSSINNIWTGGGTISVWLYALASTNDVILMKNRFSMTAYDASSVRFVKNFSGGNNTWTFSGFGTNAWHHWVLVYDSDSPTNDPTAYMDGKLVTVTQNGLDTTGTSTDDSSDTLNFVGNTSATDYSGFIDDVRFFDESLTPGQVAWLYDRGRPAYWLKMDECTGTTLNNSGTTGTSATLYPVSNDNTSAGTCVGGASTQMWYNGATGKRNGSVDYDGNDDYAATADTLVLTNSTSITTTTLSWGAWVKPATATVSDTLFIKGDGATTDNEFRLTTDANGKPQCEIYRESDNTWQTAAVGSSALATTAWSHVLCVYNGTDIRVYVNGQLSGTPQSETDSITSTSTTPLTLGSDPNNGSRTGFFDGQIDEVKIWMYDLTADQVKREYNGAAVRFGP